MQYAGRFAPSPTGKLHFGSLICALGSYLRARACGGKIYIRIEDLDFTRCSKEHTVSILTELSELGFEYDGKPFIQSEHTLDYLKVIRGLALEGLVFPCSCTRAELKIRPCSCFLKKNTEQDLSNARSIRFLIDAKQTCSFEDKLHGTVVSEPEGGSITLRRADGVIAYNLACVVDDIRQGITEVVRGSDLLPVTAAQLYLYRALQHRAPDFVHLPLVLDRYGNKLSKQNNAPEMKGQASPSELLLTALSFLKQDITNLRKNMCPKEILHKAISRFSLDRIPLEPAAEPNHTGI